MELLIVGASARSAAFSALRAGFQPSTIDLFADADLIQACPVRQVAAHQYPQRLADLADPIDPTRWMYTGALENHPDLVDRISLRHQLLGNPGSVLRAVRDPVALAEALRSNGLDAPEVRLDPKDVPNDGSWLIKPKASAGGRGIRPFLGIEPSTIGSHYYQSLISGQPLSALFLGASTETICLGITRQYVGRPGNRFAYRGTLAPWPVANRVADQIERLGRTLAENFGLSGIFGVDLILSGDRVSTIEVNPRYTAAVEALEWATGQSILARHLDVFGIKPRQSPVVIRGMGFVGKAILFATHRFIWPESWLPPLDRAAMPEIADIPVPGTKFDLGEPVLTVLASGDNPADCRRNLGDRVRRWRRRLRQF